MKSPTVRRLVQVLVVFVLLLLAPALSPDSSPAIAQGTPPHIPHPIQFRENCLLCHSRNIVGVPRIPDDHAGRTNDLCRDCHTPAAATPQPAAGGAPAVPHTLVGRENCVECHIPAAGGTAPGQPPVIPHTLVGRDDCVACHETGVAGAPVFPTDHAGRTSDMCQACHHPTSGEAAPAPAGPPAIPHTLDGRDDCVACHEKGVGGAPAFPADHAGRTSDMCQGCHHLAGGETTPAQASVPLPTPIAHPQAEEGVDTCVECHASLGGKQTQMTVQWQRSVHAERNVSCADCHGGNPAGKTVDEAMSPAAGYVGAPAKADIPALCASCHADVNQMRQYDLPTDQYAKYRESTHGVRLAQGDTNVATCYDCHGGHETLKANDPASSVYPTNVPTLCSGCHSDETLMAPYHIPTNQYELYRQSVHGEALIDKQDFRSPTCATCHGTHGAAPPGFEEVANVCGSCHSATQDHYLQSAHAKVDGGPKCVTCHGRYDVGKPSEGMYLGTEPRHCGSCHPEDSPTGFKVTQTYDFIDGAAKAYEEADASVKAASDLGMLVAPQEALLREANTQLVTARASQHDLNVDQVFELTTKATVAATAAKAGAEAAIHETVFRRQAMVVAIAAIALTILALYLLKRQLDRRLHEDEQDG